MGLKSLKERNYENVALLFIIIGLFIFVYGLIGWLVDFLTQTNAVGDAFRKITDGAILTVLGYIQMELELLRHK